MPGEPKEPTGRRSLPNPDQMREEQVRAIEFQISSDVIRLAFGRCNLNHEKTGYTGVGIIVDKNTGVLMHLTLIGNRELAIGMQENLLKSDPSLGWIFMNVLLDGTIDNTQPAKIHPPDGHAVVNILEAVRNYNLKRRTA